jgi:hypothetical protein
MSRYADRIIMAGLILVILIFLVFQTLAFFSLRGDIETYLGQADTLATDINTQHIPAPARDSALQSERIYSLWENQVDANNLDVEDFYPRR